MFFLPPGGGGAIDVGNGVIVVEPPTYRVGGSVLGLGAGDSVTLRLNDDPSADIVLTSNTRFQFEKTIPSGAEFRVLVSATAGTACAITENGGHVKGSSITDVEVVCGEISYPLQVNVTGLEAGNSILIQNNGGDDLPVSTNGVATFSQQLPAGAGYNIVVVSQPGGDQLCNTAANSTGAVGSATTVDIICGPSYYSISGSYAGLAGRGLKISLKNTGEELDFSLPDNSSSGNFTFTQKVVAATSYSVVVSQQPSNRNQVCTVVDGNGTVSSTNVTNVTVTCSDQAFKISGDVTGLSGDEEVTVSLNGGADQLLSAARTTFSWDVSDDVAYNVSVTGSPAGKSCTVYNGSGTISGHSKTNVEVSCAANKFTVSGTVSGLCPGQTVKIRNNSGTLVEVPGVFPSFTFALQSDGAAYDVTVFSKPIDVTCTVANGTGTIEGTGVSNVSINCTGCAACDGDGVLTVSWTASRSFDVNDASGGGHVVFYAPSLSVSEYSDMKILVPNHESKTKAIIPGLKRGCSYYVKVRGYSAINPNGGTLSDRAGPRYIP